MTQSATVPVLETRERILEVAPGVLRRYTLSKFSMEDVAKAAGVARQTLYKYFDGRDDLLIAMFIQEMRTHHAPLLVPLANETPSAEQLFLLFMTELRLARDYALFSDVLDPAVAPRMAELVFGSEKMAKARQKFWIPFLERYQQAGILRQNLDLADAVRWMTYQQFWFLTHPSALCDDDTDLERYVRQFIVPALVAAPTAVSS